MQGGGAGGGGLDQDGGEEIRKDSGVMRFFGVFALLITVIGLGGGFTARAEEKTEEEKMMIRDQEKRSIERSQDRHDA